MIPDCSICVWAAAVKVEMIKSLGRDLRYRGKRGTGDTGHRRDCWGREGGQRISRKEASGPSEAHCG